MLNKRNLLNGQIRLCSEDGSHQRVFTVVDCISAEGSSALCYSAYPEGAGGIGTLKEFYPADPGVRLVRTEEGLVKAESGISSDEELFSKQQSRFLEPYRKLIKAKREASPESGLENFIPYFEIFRSCNSDGSPAGTVYIWSPDPQLKTFKDTCGEIHGSADIDSEKKLVNVLYAVRALLKSVRSLHEAGFVHRDIKPSNFGFRRDIADDKPQAISLFDVDTVCSVYDEPEGLVGTPGFMEPESGSERPSNLTDIYSIGATLFYAIANVEGSGEERYLYRNGYFRRIKNIIDGSALIRATETNSDPLLRKLLTEILTKSLDIREERYPSCEEMLKDIEKALELIVPMEIINSMDGASQNELAAILRAVEKRAQKNSRLTMLYHLYRTPLYTSLPEGSKELRVLLLGFGSYGRKLMDMCLQAGQLPGIGLSITVLSKDSSDKELYLSDRPQLPDFFSIDGSEVKDSFGSIHFITSELPEDISQGSPVLSGFFKKADSAPHCVFAALGSDRFNLETARAVSKAAQSSGIPCTVSFTCDNRSALPAEYSGSAIFTDEDVRTYTDFREIERMAFNAHILWDSALNVDYSTRQEEFHRPYNYNSCISNIVSMKYKLYSVGIDLDKLSPAEAAAQFAEREDNRDLIWAEHRRWTAEKLCDGYTRLTDLEKCLTLESTRDELAREHICIVHSTPAEPLTDTYSQHSKWDSPSAIPLDKLDELDRLSIELHRSFLRKAEAAKKENLIQGANITAIREIAGRDTKVFAAFQDWFTCVKDLWDGSEDQFNRYKGLKSSFLKAAESSEHLSKREKERLGHQTSSFHRAFYPVYISMEYRDYKKLDSTLVEEIPFLLTYSDSFTMVIPYSWDCEDKTALFGNVAAAAAANPSRLIYLASCTSREELDALHESLGDVVHFMRRLKLRAVSGTGSLELITGVSGLKKVNTADLTNSLLNAADGALSSVNIILAKNRHDYADQLIPMLEERRGSTELFAAENNGTSFSAFLDGKGFYQTLPTFIFNQKTCHFRSQPSCRFLKYIRKSPFFTVADMFSLSQSISHTSNKPEFHEDYRELWRKYRSNTLNWKALTGTLKKYAETHDRIADFTSDDPLQNDTYVYMIPFSCRSAMEKIMEQLKNRRIIGPKSSISNYSTNSCRVEIVDPRGGKEDYSKLIANLYALMQPDCMSCVWIPFRKTLEIYFDDLNVDDADLSDGKSNQRRISDKKDLLKYFESIGYLIDLRFDGSKASFTFATPQIKELLTMEGKMLEVYTYHKSCETGGFDDIRSGFEISWRDTDVKNEFDCILTKGFSSLFVECKARGTIDQNFYTKLKSLSLQFGINPTIVLLADTQEHGADFIAQNELQRSRGRMMNIITISKEDEIEDIGHTLLKIINGKY